MKENEFHETQAQNLAKSFPFSTLHRHQESSQITGEQDYTNSSNLINMRKLALKRASRTIQDYHFKQNTLIGLSFVLQGVIAAATLTWMNVPY